MAELGFESSFFLLNHFAFPQINTVDPTYVKLHMCVCLHMNMCLETLALVAFWMILSPFLPFVNNFDLYSTGK